MYFEKDHIYHIYNQGNNRQIIFFNRENYLFFLKKIKTYITPYSDILAWCLMPNHFHLMVFVNKVSLPMSSLSVSSNHSKSTIKKSNVYSLSMSQRHTETHIIETEKSFNAAIGIMLMGYTKAVNKQQNRTGKLFREETKAECLDCINGLTPSFYKTKHGTEINAGNQSKEYTRVCFEYIHNNPLKAGLADKIESWEFSSAQDYLGIRNGTLVNKKIAQKYIKAK